MSKADEIRAERLERLIAAWCQPAPTLCPMCGRNVVTGTGIAGKSYGVCLECYTEAKTRAMKQQQSELDAKRKYDAARKMLERTKRDMGLPMGKRLNPVF